MATWKKVIVSGSSADLAALSLGTALPVESGGTGAATLTDGGVLVGSGTGAVTSLGQATNGQLIIGSTGADPVLATLTAGSGIAISNTAGGIEISSNDAGGTVTSIDTAGTVNGLTLTGGEITTSGTITLGGALANVTNSQLSTGGTLVLGSTTLTLGTTPTTTVAGLTSVTSTDFVGALTGNASTATKIASITNSNIVQLAATQALTNKDLTGAGNTFPTFNQDTSGNAATATLATTATTANGVAVNSVALGTDTTGNYVASLGTLTGLTTTGNSGESSTPTLAVAYGSAANTAVEGDATATFAGTANEVTVSDSSAQAIGGNIALTIGLPDDVTIGQDLTVTRDVQIGRNAVISGNLTVSGTASFQNTTNLDVADRFIRMASGSTAVGDGGIIVQQTGPANGEAFAYDAATTRWSTTGSFDPSTEAYTPDSFISLVVEGAASDPTAVIAKFQKKGNIFVGANQDIYIYS